MSSLRRLAIVLVVIAGAVLIGTQALTGTLPPSVFYPAFTVLVGGALFIRFEKIFNHIAGTWAENPAEGKRTLLLYVVMTAVIGGVGFFFIRS